MTTRSDFHDSLRPYWSAPTSRQGLRDWKMSQVRGGTRTCYYCGEEFPLADFWTGTKLSFVCPNDRAKSKRRRKKIEQEVAEQNQDQDKGGSNPLKKIGAKLAGKAASKIVEKRIAS